MMPYTKKVALFVAVLVIALTLFSTAAAQSGVIRFGFTFYDTIPCTGERIQFSGIMTVVERSEGNYHFNFSNAKGVGLSTGTVFHVAGVNHQTVNTDAAFTQTRIGRVLYVGQGRAVKVRFSGMMHVTRTPSGEMTVGFDQESFTCN